MTPTEFIEKWFSYVRNRRKQEMTDDLTAMLAEREQAIGEECAKVALSFQTEDSEPPYRMPRSVSHRTRPSRDIYKKQQDLSPSQEPVI